MRIIVEITSLLESEARVIVNPVNTDGYMGAGLAKAIRLAYPDCNRPYKELCAKRHLRIGYPKVLYTKDRPIILFPTKEHYQDPSRLEWIEKGLLGLKELCEEEGITTVGIPALGCGLGSLDIQAVTRLIYEAFKGIKDFTIYYHIDACYDWNVYYVLKHCFSRR